MPETLFLELKEFIGRPCRSGTAFEFLPKKMQQLELGKIAAKLRQKKIIVEAETPYLLILLVDGKSVSFFQSGKIMVKSCKEEIAAKETAEKLIELLK